MDFKLKSSSSIFSDKTQWTNIKDWLTKRYENKSEVQLAYINGTYGIGKSCRSRIIAREIGFKVEDLTINKINEICLLYTSPSPRDYAASRMPSSA